MSENKCELVHMFADAGPRVPLRDCPPGLFRSESGHLGFRSEYGEDAYVVASGEYWWGGTSDRAMRARQSVQPLVEVTE